MQNIYPSNQISAQGKCEVGWDGKERRAVWHELGGIFAMRRIVNIRPRIAGAAYGVEMTQGARTCTLTKTV